MEQVDKMNRYLPTVLWLLACLLFCMLNCNCASTHQLDSGLEARGFFTLEDKRALVHEYKQPIIMEHNDKLTLYCAKHFEWEVIRASYDSKQDDYIYFVTTHEKN